MAYQARWPLGVALSLVIFEGLACSAGGGSSGNQYGGASGAGASGAGATSGSGQGATGGGSPGGSNAGGNTGTGGAGNSTGTGGDAGSAGVGGDGGTAGDGGVGGIGGSGALPPFDGGSDPNRNNVMPGQVCERLATIQCAAEASCCGAPGRNFDQCKTAQLNTCRNEAYLDAVSMSPLVVFDMARAAAAFAEFERLASMCDPAIVQWAINPTMGLLSIVSGTKNANDSCIPPASQSMERPVVAAHLASCRDPAAQACLPLRLLAWECRPRGQVGADCFSDLNCVEGVYCDNPSLMVTGAKCVARKLKDATCATSNECQSLFCRGGRCVAPSPGAAYCLAVR